MRTQIPLEAALFFVQQLPATHQQVILSWLQQNIDPGVLASKPPLSFGGGRHLIQYVSDDFDAPLNDFKDYM
ncbi:MAG: hypothetical protein ACFCUI_12245 [Bernardetiaceae bacterium]